MAVSVSCWSPRFTASGSEPPTGVTRTIACSASTLGVARPFANVLAASTSLLDIVIGALIAFMAMIGLQNVLTDAISRNSDFSRGFYVTSGDAIYIGLLLVAIGASIGVIGALIGLRRFIEA